MAWSDLYGQYKKQPGSLRTADPPIRVEPALLFCRKMVESAFEDAIQTKDGLPTQEAVDAVTWISQKTDWSLIPLAKRMEKWGGAPAPPKELRDEVIATFDWACRWLGLDPDTVRSEGLPRKTCRREPFRHTVVPKYRQRTRPVVANHKHTSKHTGGLKAIFAEWERAAAEWEAKQREAPLDEPTSEDCDITCVNAPELPQGVRADTQKPSGSIESSNAQQEPLPLQQSACCISQHLVTEVSEVMP